MPPAGRFAKSDDAQQNATTGGHTNQGTHEAPRRRARQDGDNGQNDQMHNGNQIEILRGHGISPVSQTAGLKQRAT
jgi:hypothetical protein